MAAGRRVKLPGTGSLAGLTGRQDSSLIFYSFTSPLYPATVFSYDVKSSANAPFDPPKTSVDVGQYETKQMFAVSKDGTRCRSSSPRTRTLARDGSNPTMLYGYGGFSISETPTYRPDVPAFLEQGGIWVTANMRGGGEYGEAWHQAGMLEKKQNVFDDFIAVAEQLIKEKYTSPAKLGISGGSNGGLLVGAVQLQRPDLFAVALPAVGVMDMLRYDRFTGGRAWRTEYGSSTDPKQFAFLYKYSPRPEHQAGHVLSGDACDDGGSRRSRRAEPLVQVHRGAPGGAVVRQAGPDPRRDARIARLSSNRQADRGACRYLGLRAAEYGSQFSASRAVIRRRSSIGALTTLPRTPSSSDSSKTSSAS